MAILVTGQTGLIDSEGLPGTITTPGELTIIAELGLIDFSALNASVILPTWSDKQPVSTVWTDR